mmetsp:Transcript_13366/g.45188  ORF Transcript_13366/g.45188 Transcript_13366/m.45188 type:complete len:208 (+) Transcript_13366:271-894(+)
MPLGEPSGARHGGWPGSATGITRARTRRPLRSTLRRSSPTPPICMRAGRSTAAATSPRCAASSTAARAMLRSRKPRDCSKQPRRRDLYENLYRTACRSLHVPPSSVWTLSGSMPQLRRRASSSSISPAAASSMADSAPSSSSSTCASLREDSGRPSKAWWRRGISSSSACCTRSAAMSSCGLSRADTWKGAVLNSTPRCCSTCLFMA